MRKGEKPVDTQRKEEKSMDTQNKEETVMETEKPKKCNRCKKELPPTNEFFALNRSTLDGMERFCKACAKKYRRKLKGKNIPESKAEIRETKFKVPRNYRKEPLTTATPAEILAALRKGVAREIIQELKEMVQKIEEIEERRA